MVSESAVLDLLLRCSSSEVKLGGRGSLIKADVECKMCGTRSWRPSPLVKGIKTTVSGLINTVILLSGSSIEKSLHFMECMNL